MHLPYYRGCWHGISRCFLYKLSQCIKLLTLYFSSLLKVLYNPRAFFTHAVWLDQACAHCPIFPTAASRRSLGRVSVPVWLIILSDQLPIGALVSLYLTNKLIGRGIIQRRRSFSPEGAYGISRRFQRLFRTFGHIPTRYSPVRQFLLDRGLTSPSTCMC